jgi:hypothetical protein
MVAETTRSTYINCARVRAKGELLVIGFALRQRSTALLVCLYPARKIRPGADDLDARSRKSSPRNQ